MFEKKRGGKEISGKSHDVMAADNGHLDPVLNVLSPFQLVFFNYLMTGNHYHSSPEQQKPLMCIRFFNLIKRTRFLYLQTISQKCIIYWKILVC